MESALNQLGKYSVVVADTGDFESIKAFNPRDATTNPSLILKAAQQPQYEYIFNRVVRDNPHESSNNILSKIVVAFGAEILKIIDGRVSSEVDARLSFDTKSTMEAAKTMITLYDDLGIDRERVLIKIAATWEGIQAAQRLEKEGIHCNLTLIFSLEQAAICANAGVTLISPFVGRILDWHRKNNPEVDYGKNDPGVDSVKKIFKHYKESGHKTEIMGASFRNIEEILSLSGCDLLTISPKLLKELNSSFREVKRSIDGGEEMCDVGKDVYTGIGESQFRFMFNENAMAVEKLSEGIRIFAKDIAILERMVETLG